MTISRILEGVDLKDKEIQKVLDEFDLPYLEKSINIALKTTDQGLALEVMNTLKKLYKEIGDLARRKGILFYYHCDRALNGKYAEVFSVKDGKEKLYNIIGYNIHFLWAQILLNSVNNAIRLYTIALQNMESKQRTEKT